MRARSAALLIFISALALSVMPPLAQAAQSHILRAKFAGFLLIPNSGAFVYQTAFRSNDMPIFQVTVYSPFVKPPVISADLSQLGISSPTTTPSLQGSSDFNSNWNYNFGPFTVGNDVPDGLKTVQITATDQDGNIAATIAQIAVDNAKPTITISNVTFSTTSPSRGDYAYVSGTLDGTGSAIAPGPISLELLNENNGVINTFSSSHHRTSFLDAFASSTDGKYLNAGIILMESYDGEMDSAANLKINLSVYDEAGNTATTSLTVAIPKTPPPDPCADGGCVSNVLFLPGIKGSHLYRPKDGCDASLSSCEDRLWEPGLDEGIFASLLRGAGNDDVRDLFLDVNGASARSDVYVKEKDILDSISGKDFYASFIADMDALKANETITDWEPVAYDWRLSLADIVGKGKKTGERISYLEATSTPYIEQELRRLAGSSKTGKVTIVAHSNGGLVAKALLARLGGETAKLLVDDIIFVGVPQSGAPRAVGSLLYGTGEGLPLESFDFLLSKSVAREFSENSPMAYHLLPSAQYFADVKDPAHAVGTFAGASGFAEERSAYGSTLDTASELYDFLLALEDGREKPSANDVSEANVLNETLIDYARDTHTTYDAWMPPSGITLYQVAGWGVDTVAGLRFTELPVATAGPYAATHRTMFSPTFVEDGDGVVPIPSALMTSTSSPNVKRYWVNLFDYNDDTNSNQNHSNLFEIQYLKEFIKNIIKNSTSTLPTYISTNQPAPITANKKLLFILHSPLTLQLTDFSGNTTGLSGDDSVTQNISGATYGEFGEVKYIIAPEGNYTLNMNGQESGTFTLEMQEMTGNEITSSAVIANVPTTANTLASLTVSGGIETASALSVDEDGDGATDISITPEEGKTVNYEPPAPEPEPEPTISSSGGGGGGGGYSTSIIVPMVIITATSTLATTTPVIQTVATSTPEFATSTPIVQVNKKPPVSVVAINNPQKAETPKKIENIPQTPLEIRFLTGQTASVYDAVSQQSVLKKLGGMVYNGFHSLWLALMRFF